MPEQLEQQVEYQTLDACEKKHKWTIKGMIALASLLAAAFGAMISTGMASYYAGGHAKTATLKAEEVVNKLEMVRDKAAVERQAIQQEAASERKVIQQQAASVQMTFQKEMDALEKSQAQDRVFIRDTLGTIQQDVREIRETQTRMMRHNPDGTGGGP